MMTRPFTGIINMDIRDSVPDWGPYEQPRAPEDAPNVLYIVLDDVGFGALSCFGGLIETPNIDRIAQNGVRYIQWHTTALCSPTRSCLLTGRNHTTNGMACITECATGFPGSNGHIPFENATLAEMLVERGYNTYIVGKWHLCPEDEMNLAATKRHWPLGRGFERFYGFLGAETNQWSPDLVYDNHPVDPPRTPEEGYHFTEDITDKALAFIRGARPWDTLAADEQRLFARMAEVYAGFLSHADHHIGRLLDALAAAGELDNTLVIVVSDNGASGEGGPNGSVNENKVANGIPDDPQENLRMLEELGGPKTYNHYPNGWAMAFNTPFKMWKRYEFNGGSCDPCIMAWPQGMAARGEIREQYHHAIDVVPTILECTAIAAPDVVKGYTQSPIQGVSMAYSFDHPAAPGARHTQFYSMLGSRGLWHEGWKVVTTHPTVAGWGHFTQDTWELYHTDEDRAELHNRAHECPEKLQELIALWFSEAGANQAFPLDDRSAIELLTTPRPQMTAPHSRYVYFPGGAEIPESVAVNIRNRSYAIGALVDIPDGTAEGVLFAHGSRFGGHALYVKDKRLHYVYDFVGSVEQKITSTEEIPRGSDMILSAAFEKEGEESAGTARGTLSLYFGDRKVGAGTIKTQPGKFAVGGEGLNVGCDRGEAVTTDYPGTAPWAFSGGTIKRVAVDVSGEPYVDLEREAVAMMARE